MKKIFRALKYMLSILLIKIASSFAKTEHKKIFLKNLKNLKYSIREDFIVSKAEEKRILHFGFLDDPFTEEKFKNNALLHQKLMAVSKNLFGVDINQGLNQKYRELSGDYNNVIWDIEKENIIPEAWKNSFDLIVFGEILEHLKEPYSALKKLKNISELSGAKIIISVPNVFSFLGFIEAVRGVELVHPDHFYYFSPATLEKLLKSAGFTHIDIILTGNKISRLFPGLMKPGIIAIAK